MGERLKPGARILLISDLTNEPSENPLTAGVNNLVNQLEQNLTPEYSISTINASTLYHGQPLFPHKLPTRYPPFSLAIPDINLWKAMREEEPDAIGILTPEGTIGRLAKWFCHFPGRTQTKDGQKIPYTISYNTNWDEYWSIWIKHDTQGRIDLPPQTFNPFFKFAYKGADTTFTPTPKHQQKLQRMGIKNVQVLPRGVDSETFRTLNHSDSNPYFQYNWYQQNPLLIYGYHGRISIVKGIENFLSIPTPDAHKVIIGSGPYRQHLEENYGQDPQIHFLGPKYSHDLANHIRFQTLSFFPSLTDTFGQAILEATSSGVPVIGFNVPGPGEIIHNGITGVTLPIGVSMHEAIPDALRLNRANCAMFTAYYYTWYQTAQTFLQSLHQISWT